MEISIIYEYDFSVLGYTEYFEGVPGFETPYAGNSDPAFFGIELDSFTIYENPLVASLNLKATKEQLEKFKLLFNKLNDEQKDILKQLGEPEEVFISCT